jgi:hypothetical protein
VGFGEAILFWIAKAVAEVLVFGGVLAFALLVLWLVSR